MKLTEKERKEFDELAEALIKFMAEKLHPHTTTIITSTHAELLEGQLAIHTDKYLRD